MQPGFLRGHAAALAAARREDRDDRAFSYGRVVNTANEVSPTSEATLPSFPSTPPPPFLFDSLT